MGDVLKGILAKMHYAKKAHIVFKLYKIKFVTFQPQALRRFNVFNMKYNIKGKTK